MNKRYSMLQAVLFVTMFTSSVVLIEPSPYDLLMMFFLSIILLSVHLKLNRTITLPIILSLFFLLANIVSMFIVKHPTSTIMYFIITCYLVMTFVLLISFFQKAKAGTAHVILVGYYCAAIIATVIGVLAYFDLLPSSNLFLMFGRVKSTFKDPNVFGPFLIIPALYALSLSETVRKKEGSRVLHFLLFILLTIGIIISFSRAAWGSFVISLFLYLLMTKRAMVVARLRTILFIIILMLPVIAVLVQSPAIEELLSSRLTIKKYDSDRFGTQKEAFYQGFSNLLGLGPGQSEREFQYSPHSLYARVFTENGVVGILTIISIVLISVWQSIKNYRQSDYLESPIYAIVFSSLIGLAFNSFFIDTLHWRHFWILLAIAWLPFTPSNEEGTFDKGEKY